MLRQGRQWHPTPVLLHEQSHGWRSLGGCSPWGCWGSDMTEQLHFHFSLSCIGEGNGNPLQCSCLQNPRDGGAWWAVVYGVTQSWTRLKWLSSSSNPISYPTYPFLTLPLPYFLYLTLVFTTKPCSVLLSFMLGDPLFSWIVFLPSFCCTDTIKSFFDPLYSFVSISLNSTRYSTCFRLPILFSLMALYLLRWSMLLFCPVIINWNLRISPIKVCIIFPIHLFYLWQSPFQLMAFLRCLG